VTLIGVTKGVPDQRAGAAVRAGLLDLGENRIQEWLPKAGRVGPGVRWHFVGHLQTNKVRYLERGIGVLHSLHSLELLEAVLGRWPSWQAGLERTTGRAGPICLVQVNVAAESTKYGLDPRELMVFLERAASLGCARLDGLMTIAPYAAHAESVRWVFARLRELGDEARRRFAQLGLEHLSMGMSGDFEVAVEEGATMVRIGTAIFGPRG
jgi:hypothetical protein